jgi:mannose-1-phosphate guanylyltransferase
MKAVVLVGGQGTRLRPITYDIPKALVPLRNRPFMGYMLDFLRRGGLDGAVLSLGYLPDPIQAYLEGWDGLQEFSVDYAVEGRALGTAGGIKNAGSTLTARPSSWSTATFSRARTSPRR